MNTILKLGSMTSVVLLTIHSISARAQTLAGKKKQQARPEAVSTTVSGSGTSGQIATWTCFNGSSFVIDDSNITQDKFGRIGIRTTEPLSPLTVAGDDRDNSRRLQVP